MKKISLILFFLAFACQIQAQGSKPSGGGSSSGSGGVGPSNIVRPPMGPAPEKLGTPVRPAGKTGDKQSQPFTRAPQSTYRPIFTQPGIVVLKENGYVGVDHLYNVSGNIPVVVEIVRSEGLAFGASEGQIQGTVEAYFQRDGINTMANPGVPLPFFQVLVMILPSGEGMSAFCAGRLFEKVTLDRVILPQSVYFQAITWEYQTIIYASKEDIDKQIMGVVGEIAQQFVSRYRFYKNMTPASQ